MMRSTWKQAQAGPRDQAGSQGQQGRPQGPGQGTAGHALPSSSPLHAHLLALLPQVLLHVQLHVNELALLPGEPRQQGLALVDLKFTVKFGGREGVTGRGPRGKSPLPALWAVAVVAGKHTETASLCQPSSCSWSRAWRRPGPAA